MAKPLALIGVPSKDIIEKVISLRNDVRSLGYGLGEQYLLTIPHLTLAVNPDFQGSFDEVAARVFEMVQNLHPFSLETGECIVVDDNVAVQFDNTYSKKLANNFTERLDALGFGVVETDFMKIIRSEVRPEYQEKIKSLIAEALPKTLRIERIALAGKLLREEDILWEVKLN